MAKKKSAKERLKGLVGIRKGGLLGAVKKRKKKIKKQEEALKRTWWQNEPNKK